MRLMQKGYSRLCPTILGDSRVSGSFLLLVTSITIWHQRSELREQNGELIKLSQNQTTEIQRLETLLTPFRTVALDKFAGPEGEALKQLGDHILAIDESLSRAKKELVKTKQELLRRTSDRSLTEEQKQSLKSSLGAIAGKVLVKADFADSEARMFADQIEACIRTTALEIVQQGSMGIISLHAKGVRILVKDAKNPPPHFGIVQKALQSIGIEALAGVTKSAEFPDDAIVIWVCHK